MSFFVQLLLLNQTRLPQDNVLRQALFFRFADCLNMIYHCHRLLKAYAVCPLSHANDVS